MRRFAVLFLVCATLIASTIHADQTGIDVSGYLGQTVGEVKSAFPDLVKDSDNISGRPFITDGKVCFYYGYVYNDEDEDGLTIDRIVLNQYCGAEYRFGELPGGSTFGDERILLENMGYKLLFETDGERHFWMDDEGHLMIVTHGMWAGACETDYSMVVENE